MHVSTEATFSIKRRKCICLPTVLASWCVWVCWWCWCRSLLVWNCSMGRFIGLVLFLLTQCIAWFCTSLITLSTRTVQWPSYILSLLVQCVPCHDCVCRARIMVALSVLHRMYLFFQPTVRLWTIPSCSSLEPPSDTLTCGSNHKNQPHNGMMSHALLGENGNTSPLLKFQTAERHGGDKLSAEAE